MTGPLATPQIVPVTQTAAAPKRIGHAEGKQRRRRAILDAAQQIVAEEGEPGLTMRGIAARAGVALVTPYNLFGSKKGVLEALCEEQLQDFFVTFPTRGSATGASKLFDLIDFNFEIWSQAPDFYGAFLEILYGRTGHEMEPTIWEPRIAVVQKLLADAISAGDLVGSTPLLTVARNVIRLLGATTQEWIHGLITLEQAHHESAIGALMLIGSYTTEKFGREFSRIKRKYDYGRAP